MEKTIINTIGEPAVLEQLAEECAELGHAALKLARVLRGENFTPVTENEAFRSLFEETADVRVCMTVLAEKYEELWNTDATEYMKAERWVYRVTGGKLCRSCQWWDKFGCVCTNGSADDRADYVGPYHTCGCWEGYKPTCNAKPEEDA